MITTTKRADQVTKGDVVHLFGKTFDVSEASHSSFRAGMMHIGFTGDEYLRVKNDTPIVVDRPAPRFKVGTVLQSRPERETIYIRKEEGWSADYPWGTVENSAQNDKSAAEQVERGNLAIIYGGLA